MKASAEIQEIAIITGASSGIGAATARELARREFHVLAGVRRNRDADAIRGPGIEPLIIDITNPDHIRALATRVHGDTQGRTVDHDIFPDRPRETIVRESEELSFVKNARLRLPCCLDYAPRFPHITGIPD